MNTATPSELTIRAFGGLTIGVAGHNLDDLIPLKARALLLFVCRQGEPQSREKLASLLWSDSPADGVAPNPRGALIPVREHLSTYVEIGRTEIAVHAWLDVNAFESMLDEVDAGAKRDGSVSEAQMARLEEALALYRGDYLD